MIAHSRVASARGVMRVTPNLTIYGTVGYTVRMNE